MSPRRLVQLGGAETSSTAAEELEFLDQSRLKKGDFQDGRLALQELLQLLLHVESMLQNPDVQDVA